MRRLALIVAAAAVTAAAYALVVRPAAAGDLPACPDGMSCGSYAVAGLGVRKQAVTAAGGDTLTMAVAMLETDTMTTAYPYGDGKTGDATNFGIFKQNWYMLRQACPRFAGRPAHAYHEGAVLNGDLVADVACIGSSRAHYGLDAWFAGHRNGTSGLADPDTGDIRRYRAAVEWIRDRLTAPGAATDDTRYWVDVPAI